MQNQNPMILPTRNDTDRTGHWRDNQALRYESYKGAEKSPIHPNFQVKGHSHPIQSPKTRLTNTYADHFYHEANVDKYITHLDKGGRPNTGTQTPRSTTMSSQSQAQLKTISRLDRDGIRAGIQTRPTPHNPIVSCTEMAGPPLTYTQSRTQHDFVRPGFSSHQALRKSPEPQIKLGHPGVYNPAPKFNTKNFKHKNLPPGELET
jgi:hypothetical protein